MPPFPLWERACSRRRPARRPLPSRLHPNQSGTRSLTAAGKPWARAFAATCSVNANNPAAIHRNAPTPRLPSNEPPSSPSPAIPTFQRVTNIDCAASAVSFAVFAEAVCSSDGMAPNASLPDFMIHDAVAEGRLQRVLDAYVEHTGQFWVLWSSSRHATAKLRVFIDHLSMRLFPATEGR